MSIFGPIVSPWNVEEAAVALIRKWLPTYLAEIERQNSLVNHTIPRPGAYRAGTDFEAWVDDENPTVIVVCPPTSTPEPDPSSGYGQWYDLQVGVINLEEDEATARKFSALTITAAATLVAQHGSLDGIASDTILTAAPEVRMPDPDKRRLTLGVCAFHVFVQPILDRTGGPAQPDPDDPPDTPYPDWPTVIDTDVTITADPLNE